MKKYVIGFLFFCLLISACFTMSACKESTIGLYVVLSGASDNKISRTYGNNKGLADFTVIYGYDIESGEDVTNLCEINVYSPNDTSFTFDEYKQKVAVNTLDIGNWTIVIEYNEIETYFTVQILKLTNNNVYSLKLNCLVDGYNQTQNIIPYGTKESGCNITVIKNNLSTDIIPEENIGQIKKLKSDTIYSEKLQPSAQNTENFDFSNLATGTYYICTIINDELYEDKFTNFSKLEVVKSKIVVDSSNLKFSWAYSSTGPFENAKFSEIMENNSTLSYSGGSLILCSDNIADNNDLSNNQKLTKEEVVYNYFNYGNFVAENDNINYNYSAEKYDVSVKFVPNETYSSLFEESDYFTAELNILKGTVSLPTAKTECCDTTHTFSPFKTHTMQIYAQYPELYKVETNGNEEYINKYAFNNYSLKNAGTLYVKYELKYKLNYDWRYEYSRQDNINLSLDNQNKIAEFSMLISKASLEDYNFSIKSLDNSNLKFSSDNTVSLMLTHPTDNQEYLENNFTWEVLPEGTEINGTTSLATGTISEQKDHLNDTSYKTLYLTNILSYASDYDALTFAIKVTFTESNNWLAGEKIFLISIFKNK